MGTACNICCFSKFSSWTLRRMENELSIRDFLPSLFPPSRRLPPLPNEIMLGQRGTWLLDSYRQISRLQVFGPSGFQDCASATLRCKICYLATLEREGGREGGGDVCTRHQPAAPYLLLSFFLPTLYSACMESDCCRLQMKTGRAGYFDTFS